MREAELESTKAAAALKAAQGATERALAAEHAAQKAAAVAEEDRKTAGTRYWHEILWVNVVGMCSV